MPVVAFVTKTNASVLSTAPSSQIGAGGVGYVLRSTRGKNLGAYKSVGDAKKAFRTFYGTSRLLHWEQRDMTGDIEQHVAIGTPLDAKDIYGSFLTALLEPSKNPGSVELSNATTGAIFRVNDLSGNGHVFQQVGSPLLVNGGSNFLTKNVVRFDRTVPQGFTVPTFTTLNAPYEIAVVADNRAPGVSGNLLQIGPTGAGPLLISDDGTGKWRVSAGAASVVGPMSGLPASIITLQGDGSQVAVRIDGVLIGTIADTQGAAGTVEVGGTSTVPWDGDVGYVSIASQADKSNQRIILIERYLRETYQ